MALARGCLGGYAEVAGMPAEMAALYAWAGEATRRDLASRREAVELARLRAWTAARGPPRGGAARVCRTAGSTPIFTRRKQQ